MMIPLYFLVLIIIINISLILRSLFAWLIWSRVCNKLKYIEPISKKLYNDDISVVVYDIEKNETIEKVHEDLNINLGVHTNDMPWDSSNAPFKLKVKRYLKKLSIAIFNMIQNLIIFVYNFTLWSFKETSSKKDIMTIFYKTLNAYLAFISFAYIFIITLSTQIFSCDKVKNNF